MIEHCSSTAHHRQGLAFSVWIPGHVGIPGNERADRVAKAALSLPISPVKVSAMDFLPRAKLLMRKEWQEIWNCCDGNKLDS